MIVVTVGGLINSFGFDDEYIQVAGLIDIHTDFGDGAHSLEHLVKLAKKRGFNVLFINDHDRMTLEYGVRPFQNILKKKVEKPSINKGKPENYLNTISSVSKKYPEMILIPGAESSPFYYWKGNYFKKNLTVCDWEKHLLIVGLENPRDYRELPILHNGCSTKYVTSLISVGFFLLFIPLIIGLFMLRARKAIRYSGIIIFIFFLLLIFNNHLFKSSPFDQYHGPQGILPYQLLIDYVNSRGGMVFWNHPEARSGRGRLGSVFRETHPYPHTLVESKSYTGFAALYGDTITVTEPGNIWDRILKEYCSGLRKSPVWGISSADFHEDGSAGERLGNFPTVFLVKNKTKNAILNALKKGRMYAYRGNVDLPQLVLEEFSIYVSETSRKAVMGEEIVSKGHPTINISISSSGIERENNLTVRLIRYGELLRSFSGKTPISINFQDYIFEPGKKIYYRLDVRDRKNRKLISNPIFVQF